MRGNGVRLGLHRAQTYSFRVKFYLLLFLERNRGIYLELGTSEENIFLEKLKIHHRSYRYIYIRVGEHISSYFDHKLKIYLTFFAHFIHKQNRTKKINNLYKKFEAVKGDKLTGEDYTTPNILNIQI